MAKLSHLARVVGACVLLGAQQICEKRPMTGHRTQLKGYRLDKKTGRLVKFHKAKDAAAKARERGSKKVTVKRRGAI